MGPSPRWGPRSPAWVWARWPTTPISFPPSVRETLARRLQEALGQPLGSSRDAGEHVILWGVPPSDSPLDQGAYVAAYERLREGGL